MQILLQENFILPEKHLTNPSERLIYLLKKSGYNQPELADMLPVSVSTINRWFNGETKHIDKKKRELYANIMGFDLRWIEEGGSLDQAHAAVDRLEDATTAYIADQLPQDDPEKLLELAETLIRTAKELMKKKRD